MIASLVISVIVLAIIAPLAAMAVPGILFLVFIVLLAILALRLVALLAHGLFQLSAPVLVTGMLILFVVGTGLLGASYLSLRQAPPEPLNVEGQQIRLLRGHLHQFSHPYVVLESRQSVVESVVEAPAVCEATMIATAEAEELLEVEASETEKPKALAEATVEQPDPPPAGPSRPAWIDRPRVRVGDTERRVVSEGPWSTVEECHKSIEVDLMRATSEYMTQEFDDGTSIGMHDLQQMGVTSAYVWREVCTDEFAESSWHQFDALNSTEMKTLHVLMEFSPSVRRDLERRWEDYVRQERMQSVTFVAGAVVGLLALVYGLLRIDTWTKGYYSKRLLIGVPAIIILIACLVFLIGVA